VDHTALLRALLDGRARGGDPGEGARRDAAHDRSRGELAARSRNFR
jgi:hypothetical protein